MAEATLNTEPDRIIDRKERRQIIPLSDSQWDRLEHSGVAPARVQISARRVGWWLSEVIQYGKSLPRNRPAEWAA